MKFKIRKYYLNERNHKKGEPDLKFLENQIKNFQIFLIIIDEISH